MKKLFLLFGFSLIIFSCNTNSNTNTLNPYLHIQPTKTKQPNINIGVSFDSKDRKYMYGDELKMAVMSDKNCYFKVLHIETNTNTNNRVKMIYPTKNDNKNYLQKNVNRNVFQNQNNQYIFSPPYGNGIIMVVASTKQFKNIKSDMNPSWITVEGEELNEMMKGDDKIAFIINILKPDEEYEYSKPDNMTEIYQIIQNDTKIQGGFFEGNETRGVYIINNIRGSYYVINDTKTIQFTTYYLSSKLLNLNKDNLPKASFFNFSFSIPENISQVIQSVRRSIENKGGTFNGNEQEGNFRANGITGQYQISDLVNIIIIEKPFVVPYSLIEKEIKNYFNAN